MSAHVVAGCVVHVSVGHLFLIRVLVSLLELSGFKFGADQVAELMSIADTNQDGVIDTGEFKRHFRA